MGEYADLAIEAEMMGLELYSEEWFERMCPSNYTTPRVRVNRASFEKPKPEFCDLRILHNLRETEKAVFVKFDCDLPEAVDGIIQIHGATMWVPKSQMHASGDRARIPFWLMCKRIKEHYEGVTIAQSLLVQSAGKRTGSGKRKHCRSR